MAEDLTIIEDFSERITAVKGAKIGVFWNVEGIPFPDSIDPDVIYKKFESALIDRECMGKMSIWAYVDEKKESWGDFLRKKTWKSRIYFLPGGDIPSKRMLNDILLWKWDSPVDHPDPAYLIVVSDKVSCDTTLYRTLKISHDWTYSVYIVEPIEYVSPERPEWPGSLLDQGYSFERGTKSEEEGNPPKRQAVAEGSKDQG